MHLLGEPQVVLADSTRIVLRPTMRDQALAHLAYIGTWVPRDRLAFLFWPDTVEETARHNLRQLLKRIRRLTWLEAFEVDDDRVRWRVSTDVADLRAAIDEHRHDRVPPDARLLPGIERDATVDYADWLDAERERVRLLWRQGLFAAAESADESGDPARAAGLLAPLLAGEDAEIALPAYMELAARGGDRRAALDGYEQVSARLRADLGVEPATETRELSRRGCAGPPRQSRRCVQPERSDVTPTERR